MYLDISQQSSMAERVAASESGQPGPGAHCVCKVLLHVSIQAAACRWRGSEAYITIVLIVEVKLVCLTLFVKVLGKLLEACVLDLKAIEQIFEGFGRSGRSLAEDLQSTFLPPLGDSLILTFRLISHRTTLLSKCTTKLDFLRFLSKKSCYTKSYNVAQAPKLNAQLGHQVTSFRYTFATSYTLLAMPAKPIPFSADVPRTQAQRFCTYR
jgi:hypothetical protein